MKKKLGKAKEVKKAEEVKEETQVIDEIKEEVQVVEEVKEVEVKEPTWESKYLSQVLGSRNIVSVSKQMLNGREYIRVGLSDNTTSLLSERDLEAQLKK